jgi:hypothetical protein
VVTPPISPELWRTYLRRVEEPEGDITAREIVVVALASEGGFGRGAVAPPASVPRRPPPGFSVVEVVGLRTSSYIRYASPQARRLTHDDLVRLRLTEAAGRVFFLPGT